MANLFAELARGAKGKLRFPDGTYIRVHQDGAPALRDTDHEGVGTSRGGRNSKLHAVVDIQGRLVRLMVIPGNVHDLTAAPELVADMPEVIVVADKAYESAAFRALIAGLARKPEIYSPTGASKSRRAAQQGALQKAPSSPELLWSNQALPPHCQPLREDA